MFKYFSVIIIKCITPSTDYHIQIFICTFIKRGMDHDVSQWSKKLSTNNYFFSGYAFISLMKEKKQYDSLCRLLYLSPYKNCFIGETNVILNHSVCLLFTFYAEIYVLYIF